MLALACVPAAYGTAFTLNDPFGAGSPDVIGATTQFDIQKGEFNFGTTSGTIKLYFNFGDGNTSLAPFNYNSVILNVGDLFISGSGYSYGVGLTNHAGGITAGTLYSVNNANGSRTAAQVLNSAFCPTCYRPNEVVWLNNDGVGSLTALSTGSISVVNGGDGIINPEFVVTINLTYAAGIGAKLNNAPSIHFTSATCGNDLLTGTGVPEPASLGMIGGGLLLAAGLKFRRSRAARK